MHLNRTYRLVDGVQVRNEKFGLLFYNYRGPRLYFVPSKQLLGASFFEGRVSVAEAVDRLAADTPWPRNQLEAQLTQVLETLEGKGLIHGQSIC